MEQMKTEETAGRPRRRDHQDHSMMSGQKDFDALWAGPEALGRRWYEDCTYMSCTSHRKDHSHV